MSAAAGLGGAVVRPQTFDRGVEAVCVYKGFQLALEIGVVAGDREVGGARLVDLEGYAVDGIGDLVAAGRDRDALNLHGRVGGGLSLVEGAGGA